MIKTNVEVFLYKIPNTHAVIGYLQLDIFYKYAKFDIVEFLNNVLLDYYHI